MTSLLFVGRSARQLAIGLAAGGALGVLLLVAIERRLGPLGSPWPALLLTAGTVAVVCLAATLGPAVRGARLSPLAALRDS